MQAAEKTLAPEQARAQCPQRASHSQRELPRPPAADGRRWMSATPRRACGSAQHQPCHAMPKRPATRQLFIYGPFHLGRLCLDAPSASVPSVPISAGKLARSYITALPRREMGALCWA